MMENPKAGKTVFTRIWRSTGERDQLTKKQARRAAGLAWTCCYGTWYLDILFASLCVSQSALPRPRAMPHGVPAGLMDCT